MTPDELLLLCEIVGLLQVFDDSNGMTLLDALTRGVATPGNGPLYVAALTLLSLRDDFLEFLKQPIMTFVDQSFGMMKIKLVYQGGSQLVVRKSGEMKTSPTEHPLLYIARLCQPAIRNALIPAGACLSNGGCYISNPNLSSDGSFWADMCPRCGCGCMDFNAHMDKSLGQFPNLGRVMWESIITKIAKEFFFMFCSEYAKFICWVLENPFIFANRWIRRSKFLQTGCEFEMGIPSLPGIFDNEIFVQTFLHCFVKLPTKDGGYRLVPSPFMMIIDPAKYKPINDSAHMSFRSRMSLKPKFKKIVSQTAMLTKAAKSLGCVGGFADSILRRVLHTPNEGLLMEFKHENIILMKKLLKNDGLLPVFENLQKALNP